MVALKLAFRGFLRRRWGLLLVILPIALLFGMMTFLLASEATVRQLLEPGIAPRAIRIGSVEGLTSWEASSFTDAEVQRLGRIPGVAMAPGTFQRCYTDVTERRELNCGVTNRAYVQIWAMDMPVSEADLDRWDAVKNGVIVTRAAASRHNWNVGDHINLYENTEGARNGVPMELVITSIADKYIDPTTVYIHIDYYNGVTKSSMRYWVVWVLVDKAERRDEVMAEIERQLNDIKRPHLIWTMEVTKQAILAGSEVLRTAFRASGLSSLALVVFVAVALLIISIEQRRTEIAVLLALGFRRGLLARSILAEGILLLFPAAALGALAVWIPFHDSPIMFDIIFRVKVTWIDALEATALGMLIGLLAAVVPAWRVFRLNTLSALR